VGYLTLLSRHSLGNEVTSANLHLNSIRGPSGCQLCAWHEIDRGLLDAARTRRVWSEGRERERTPQRPDGEAVPPKSRVGVGSSELPFRSLRWGI